MELAFPPKAIAMLTAPTLTFKCKTLAHLPLYSTSKTHFSSSNIFFPKTPFPLPTHSPRPTPSWVLNPTTPIASTNALSSTTEETTTAESNSPPGVLPSTHWIVVMEKPPDGVSSKSDVIDHYVKTLAKVLGSEMDAQMCIYHFSWQTHFGFCCDIDKGTSRRLAGLPGVLSVRPDMHFQSLEKDYSLSNFSLGDVSKSSGGTSEFLAEGSSKYWLVRMGKPPVEVVTKAQAVDYYAQTLTKVLGNEKDAQMRIYHISWQNHFGFCCELDEECGRELAGVPGVLSIQPDSNYESDHKDYEGGDKLQSLVDLPDKSDANQTPYIRTKRLFVTGLSFYTSEKTLRAAFEGFGELVEVKIIMDKISKRSKGYAFIEYTTEEAAGAALKEMNGKIINGWMIVVDVAKTNPNRPRPRV
eukprot:TRINITY_DN12866_c0_g1_i7.p1 TRINITY_DN12866_c0_g1~~TRINITY_DN12866_c0_g1_i7.p1  ORF type:complete len:413 (+),score=74.26 TRINITY_DN12866_c0_g1_i7:181-1419(+)